MTNIDVEKLTEQEAKDLLAKVWYHLSVVSASRNSYSHESLRRLGGIPERTPEVENMHREAAKFVYETGKKYGKK